MRKDLIVLLADIQQEKTIETLLTHRQASLNIRTISFDIYRPPSKAPGVYHGAANFLAPFVSQSQYALVVLDREWAGSPRDGAMIGKNLLNQLYSKGWSPTTCEVIVIDPELEAWVWSTSPHVATVLRTKWDKIQKLAQKRGYWAKGQPKPTRPKELLQAILKQQRRPSSSSIFQELARKVGLARCQDQSFILLRDTVAGWFPRY